MQHESEVTSHLRVGDAPVGDRTGYFDHYFERLTDRLAAVSHSDLDAMAVLLQSVGDKGRKVIVAGNGGSAAMASHVSVDLTKTAGVRSVSFNESDLITCFANDYGYEHWLERAIDCYADAHDVAILISSSGRSANIVNAAHEARRKGLAVVTFSGFDAANPLRQIGHTNFWVDSTEYNIVEMVHHIWLVAVVDRIVANKLAGA